MSTSDELAVGRPMGRGSSFVAMTLAYVVAFAAGALLGPRLAPGDPLWTGFAADLVATVVVFGFSVAFNNSSMYDPYWSVAPPALAGYWAWSAGADADPIRQAAVFGLVALWAARLTFNFARGWPGMVHEDWRYVAYRRSVGKLYWGLSFAGIHMFPTLLVFAGCLSVWVAMTSDTPFGWLDGVAIVVTGGAIVIESVADEQLRKFRASNPPRGAIINTGLWAWSRHPNYFGELSLWWGLWLFALSAAPELWWTFAGPAAMTFLFFVVSVPLLDKRSIERRPAYAEHMKRVSGIIPLPPRRPSA